MMRKQSNDLDPLFGARTIEYRAVWPLGYAFCPLNIGSDFDTEDGNGGGRNTVHTKIDAHSSQDTLNTCNGLYYFLSRDLLNSNDINQDSENLLMLKLDVTPWSIFAPTAGSIW